MQILVLLSAMALAVSADSVQKTPFAVSGKDVQILNLVMGDFTIKGQTYSGRYSVENGGGPFYQEMDGQPILYIPKSDPNFRITYINKTPSKTSMHPHGLTGPMDTDGVSYLTQPPIPPGSIQMYDFPILARDQGTHFVHSHYALMHADGLSIPLIVEDDPPPGYPLAAEIKSANDAMMFMEDYCPYVRQEGTNERWLNLYCNDTMGVYLKLKERWDTGADTYPMEECRQPFTMDDVGFRYHLVNGRVFSDPPVTRAKPGQYIRVRMIPSISFVFLRANFTNLDATIIAADGKWVKPRNLRDPSPDRDTDPNTFWMAAAQRYDVLVKAPETPGVYPIVIEVQVADDGQQQQSGMLILVGDDTPAPPPGTFSDTYNSPHHIYMWNEPYLESWFNLPPRKIDRELTFNITGDNGFRGINGYSWQMPPMVPEMKPNPAPLMVRAGERVCVNMNNFSPWTHPFHVHGHRFQVVSTKFGSMGVDELRNGPIRDTVQTSKGCGTVRFCFDALNPGIWLIHCHKDMHAAAGMITSIEYTGEAPLDPTANGNGPLYDPFDVAYPNWGKQMVNQELTEVPHDSILISRSQWAQQQQQSFLSGDDSNNGTNSNQQTPVSTSTKRVVAISSIIGALIGAILVGGTTFAVVRRGSFTHSRLESEESGLSGSTNCVKDIMLRHVVCTTVGILALAVVALGVAGLAGITSDRGQEILFSVSPEGFSGNADVSALNAPGSASYGVFLSATQSHSMADTLVGLRPFASETDLYYACQKAASALSIPSALAAIRANAQQLWTTRDASGQVSFSNDLNTYEQRFGFPFLASSGKVQPGLWQRLRNSASTEFSVATKELALLSHANLIASVRANVTLPPPPPIRISTIVTDETKGRPAGGMSVTLESRSIISGNWVAVASATTGVDGSAFFDGALPPVTAGEYRIVYDAGDYFNSYGTATQFTQIIVPFSVVDGQTMYSIPVRVGPFGYETFASAQPNARP